MPRFYKTKFELSPRLKLGVGRSYSQNKGLKIATIICLVLALALTGNAIRLILSHKAPNNPSSPEVLGVTDTKDATQPQFFEYKVKKGDTLFNLSQQFKIDWQTLASLNNLKSPFSLKPGQTLNIPK